MTDSKLPLTPKVAFFWADNLWPYHAKCITRCFNSVHYFQPHFAIRSVTRTYIFWPSIPLKGVYLNIIFTLEWYWWHFAIRSVTRTYIFWPSIPLKGVYLNIIFTLEWYWCIHGYFLSLSHIQWIQNGCRTVVGLIIIELYGFKYDSMILGSQ